MTIKFVTTVATFVADFEAFCDQISETLEDWRADEQYAAFSKIRKQQATATAEMAAIGNVDPKIFHQVVNTLEAEDQDDPPAP